MRPFLLCLSVGTLLQAEGLLEKLRYRGKHPHENTDLLSIWLGHSKVGVEVAPSWLVWIYVNFAAST